MVQELNQNTDQWTRNYGGGIKFVGNLDNIILVSYSVSGHSSELKVAPAKSQFIGWPWPSLAPTADKVCHNYHVEYK